jgi:uncharacterized protein GlcG (DUF336 family)
MSTYDKPSITAAAAELAIDAAAKVADANGAPSVVVVVDESGHLKAARRMDGASFAATRIAEDKAYTASAFGVATRDWYGVLQEDGPLREGMLTGIDRLCTLGGGVAIRAGERVVGAIGVSGGTYDQDHEAAAAGVAAVGG